MSLKEAIFSEARRLGFSLIGVTTPEPPPHQDIYLHWLAAGRHGEMAYLAAERAVQHRADPLQILPECRSILILGIRYRPPSPPFPLNGTLGEIAFSSSPLPLGEGPGVRATAQDAPVVKPSIASYASGDDYHLLLPPRLHQLVEFIESLVGSPVPNRYYTDTGPLLERELAQRAGLGWIGKNTCLINPRQGSYFLLAELLLGIELEPDTPFAVDHCGSCTRCIDACPTACILPDRTLDARRCISYLTIELKSAIPVELRPRLGNWIFGCDICQQVCPWNLRFAQPEYDPAFEPYPDLLDLDPHTELALTPQAFNRKYRKSPLSRAKRRGYLRNIAVALGNSHSAQAVPALLHALVDAEPLVRRHAAWALGEIATPEALQALAAAAAAEADPDVLQEIQNALRGSDSE